MVDEGWVDYVGKVQCLYQDQYCDVVYQWFGQDWEEVVEIVYRGDWDGNVVDLVGELVDGIGLEVYVGFELVMCIGVWIVCFWCQFVQFGEYEGQ